MRILIIGGNSSLGSCLKKRFSETNDVVTAGRSNCDIHLDLYDTSSEINFPPDFDVIIHTAAHFGGNAGKEMLEAETINVLGTLRICEAARKANAKHFILISSIFSLLKEDSSQYSIYALSKKHSEEIAKLFCVKHELPLTILRPSQLYGNGGNLRMHQPFLYFLVDQAEKGQDINIYGTNDASRNFIFIDDVVKVIDAIVHKKVLGTFNCMFPYDVTYSQIARAAYAAFKSEGHINFLIDKEDIADNIFEKDNLLYEKIDFYPEITIEEGMKKLATYRKSLK